MNVPYIDGPLLTTASRFSSAPLLTSPRVMSLVTPTTTLISAGSCSGAVAASVVRHTALKEDLEVSPETAAELLALADQWCLPQVR